MIPIVLAFFFKMKETEFPLTSSDRCSTDMAVLPDSRM